MESFAFLRMVSSKSFNAFDEAKINGKWDYCFDFNYIWHKASQNKEKWEI